ncbi:AraC family transcriptional regulator [Marinobacter adhaerens]|jgi:AraC-like DNA-binding protein|uniref:AraC family transcriptional regulator n=2 Tax=Marinobacter adhaerens TaxID=1033846 RepID=A0ABX8IQC7_9GAMM|nr:AraC family transcriptional regulator [Marinobacter adhaerens]MCR9189980.1 AraC family transcriptional regulator [Alteromonadaceae bacterium]MTI77746.1 AraC family transcriptional regulator [Marinobacter sp.]ADP96867.1 protein containing Helix-turn-helix, AraC domain [Marinobacter adhaerens HP15]ODM28841.1 AraC family transcriptional regulator [Marinobacter adhaerens]QWV14824.1 AraC family transcriptional regulator [Marinobacter adhaerens]
MFTNVLNRSTVFKSAHPEVVSEFVNKEIGRHTIELKKFEAAQSCLSFAEFSELKVSSLSYGTEVKVRSPELEKSFHLQVIMKGNCRVTFKDAKALLETGDAIMLNPNELIILDYSSDCEKLIINIPESAVQSSLLFYQGCIPKSGIRFKRRPVNLFRFPSLIKLIETVFLEIEDYNSDTFLSFDPYKEIIVRKLLSTFISNIQRDIGDPNANNCMKNITQYIDDNLKTDINVDELAAISKVSVRSIYNMFSDSLSTTPGNYIKNRRLQRVREKLQSGAARNVTEVALDYGFMHLGRLSCNYKELFGELPSETIKKRSAHKT